MKIIFKHSAISNPHIPIWYKDKINNVVVLIMAPYKVPCMASFALFMACILAVSGLCI